MNHSISMAVSCTLLSYLIGGFNPAYIIGKMKGFDIRERGSGNAGASNAGIVFGKYVGIFVALFDIFKAYLAVRISLRVFYMLKYAAVLGSVGCILGHMFPAVMRLKGGKGLACLGGVILSYNAKLFFTLLLLELIFVLVTNYLFVVPTSASQIFTFILFLKEGLVCAVLFLPVTIAIFYKHTENMRRMKHGVEARFSYIWNKEAETERLRANWEKLTEEERLAFGISPFDND